MKNNLIILFYIILLISIIYCKKKDKNKNKKKENYNNNNINNKNDNKKIKDKDKEKDLIYNSEKKFDEKLKQIKKKKNLKSKNKITKEILKEIFYEIYENDFNSSNIKLTEDSKNKINPDEEAKNFMNKIFEILCRGLDYDDEIKVKEIKDWISPKRTRNTMDEIVKTLEENLSYL